MSRSRYLFIHTVKITVKMNARHWAVVPTAPPGTGVIKKFQLSRAMKHGNNVV